MTERSPTVEWQVCGACNYDCSYCIQSPKSRVGHPSNDEITRFLGFFRGLSGRWEVKMTGGEPFALKAFIDRIVPELIADTAHTVSVLTNLSAHVSVLDRFAALTRGRLGVLSASLHLEHTSTEVFTEKAVRLRERMDPEARMVVNSVLVPGRMAEISLAREAVERAGLQFFPQVMKLGAGVVEYEPGDQLRVSELVGISPSPRRANMAPSYKGMRCWAGAEYFVLTQDGEAWSCRTARRAGEGRLGNVLTGRVNLRDGSLECPYDICPCTVPANRGMIEGLYNSR